MLTRKANPAGGHGLLVSEFTHLDIRGGDSRLDERAANSAATPLGQLEVARCVFRAVDR